MVISPDAIPYQHAFSESLEYNGSGLHIPNTGTGLGEWLMIINCCITIHQLRLFVVFRASQCIERYPALSCGTTQVWVTSQAAVRIAI